MPRHIKTLIGILAALAVLFAAGKLFLPPRSFFVYGHYRAASVDEIASAKPKFLEPSAFSASDPKVYATWSEGIHKVIKCQDCHIADGNQLTAPRAATRMLSPILSLRSCI